MMCRGVEIPRIHGAVTTEAAAAFVEKWRPGLLQFWDPGVDVWTISLPTCFASVASFRPILGPEEQSRAQRFRRPSDRSRFISAHGALRMILAHYAHIDPGRLRFVFGRHGKPALDRELDLPDIRFNLSHSGEMAVIAVALGHEVGIDIERIEPRRADIAIAEHFFSSRELAALRTLPKADRELGFFTCWTRKEAYIKGRGEGLSIPLCDFDVSLTPGEPAALLGSRIDPSNAGRWRLQAVPVKEGYVATLAVECSSELTHDTSKR